MSSVKRLIPIPVLAAALAVGLFAFGCKESTTVPTVDPTAMATSVDALNSAFSQNAVFQSLASLSSRFTLTATVARPLTAPFSPSGGSWPASAATQRRRMQQLADRAPVAIQALFPANVLGKTFQWDTAGGGKYRILDSTLVGADGNGVRFVLYQVDTATGRPRLPLQTAGSVDLIEVASVTASILRVVLHVGTQTAADYTITQVKTTTSLTLTAVGSVTDVVASGAPVNFTLSHVLTLADSSLVTDYGATGSGATISMHSSISGTGGTSVTLDWTIEKNGSLEVVGTSTPTAINVQFKFNGTTWATVNGNPNAPTFSGANGRTLTLAELLAMGQILKGFADIADNLSGVFEPSFLVFK